MRRLACFALLAALVHAGAAGGEAPPAPIFINARINPGNLPYADFYATQQLLRSYLPAEPRVIDLRLRLSFTELAGEQRDEYAAGDWGVAIVGDTVDHTVAMAKGGYFLLPDLPRAVDEHATVMFKTQTRKNYVEAAWMLKVGPGNTLAYADFARALDEVAALQKKIPWYRPELRDERLARFDALKACFADAGGRMEIDGKPVPTTRRGRCALLRFDPAQAGKHASAIAFVGKLENLSLGLIDPASQAQ